MDERIPWYARLLTVENLLLIGGAFFLLCSLGEVTFGAFVFRPAQDVPDVARLLFAAIAIILVLGGITLTLYKANIWHTKLATIYFISTLTLISGMGIVALRFTTAEHLIEGGVLRHWAASQSGFEAQIDNRKLSRLQRGYKLLLICRKYDSSREFEKDVSIQKSSFRYLRRKRSGSDHNVEI